MHRPDTNWCTEGGRRRWSPSKLRTNPSAIANRRKPRCELETSPASPSVKTPHGAHHLPDLSDRPSTGRPTASTNCHPAQGPQKEITTVADLHVSPFLCLFLSLLISISSHLYISFHLFSVPFFISLSFYSHVCLSLVGPPFFFSMTMTMVARPVGSLCTRGPDLP